MSFRRFMSIYARPRNPKEKPRRGGAKNSAGREGPQSVAWLSRCSKCARLLRGVPDSFHGQPAVIGRLDGPSSAGGMKGLAAFG